MSNQTANLILTVDIQAGSTVVTWQVLACNESLLFTPGAHIVLTADTRVGSQTVFTDSAMEARFTRALIYVLVTPGQNTCRQCYRRHTRAVCLSNKSVHTFFAKHFLLELFLLQNYFWFTKLLRTLVY